MHGKKAFVVAVLLGAGCQLRQAPDSQPGQAPQVQPQLQADVVISGHAGAPGVVLKGLPGDPAADANGLYRVAVSPNWTGEAKPSLAGYRFEPAVRRYRNLRNSTDNQDYQATSMVFPISGSIGLDGVVMRGLPGAIRTGDDGCYRATVEYGWSGKVVPLKEGYEFSPRERSYDTIDRESIHEDYAYEPSRILIRGSVGVPGALMKGLPVPVECDRGGMYVAQVPYCWTGKISPMKEGCRFEPANRDYNQVKQDLIQEDYRPLSHALRGRITSAEDSGPVEAARIESVPVTDRRPTVTDANGCFVLEVPWNWRGQVVPMKEGQVFEPGRVWIDLSKGDQQVRLVARPRIHKTSQETQADAPSPWPGPRIQMVSTGHVDRLSELTDDLRVMAFILDEAMNGPTLVEWTCQDPNNIVTLQAQYIEDYGVIFSCQVPIGFVSSGPRPSKATDQGPLDPVWEQARRKVLGKDGPKQGVSSAGTAMLDARRVQDLVERILPNLHHTCNIRHLRPTDRITILVSEPICGSALLMIRTAKADVDAVVAGRVGPEHFRQQTQTWVY